MLYYRFPGEDLKCLEGNFVKTESIEGHQFVITDFKQENKYYWAENAPTAQHQTSVPFCIEKADYLLQATQVIADLTRGLADKIVLSRVKKASQALTDPKVLFEQLLQHYPNALIYYFHDTSLGTWMGASPEILMERTPTHWRTMALAGTKAAGEERDFTSKEYNEHAMVTEFIEGQLRQIPGAAVQVSELSTYSPGPVTHLLQELKWQMPQSVLPLLLKHLHPTPAVAGLPKKVAQQYLDVIESHERRLYTGIIGRSTSGAEKLYVNLRCAEVCEHTLYCYVGGGFTPDSVPELEWEETENKSQTLLRLL
ncbi:MAG: chorismate-binding protein [Crocinitomicaceae bacterium]|nr:chorismate-binding protein [Crocinitomicaceae bacterium]